MGRNSRVVLRISRGPSAPLWIYGSAPENLTAALMRIFSRGNWGSGGAGGAVACQPAMAVSTPPTTAVPEVGCFGAAGRIRRHTAPSLSKDFWRCDPLAAGSARRSLEPIEPHPPRAEAMPRQDPSCRGTHSCCRYAAITSPKGTVNGRSAVVPGAPVPRQSAPTRHSNRSGRSRVRQMGHCPN